MKRRNSVFKTTVSFLSILSDDKIARGKNSPNELSPYTALLIRRATSLTTRLTDRLYSVPAKL